MQKIAYARRTVRDKNIDILRLLGLALIILAHVDPPAALAQIRNFDVPLMVLVSGASFIVSHKTETYLSYIWKRTKRLLFPVWIFLTCYFLTMHFASLPQPLPNSRTILTSYLLLSGIGYVWIIRVFLLVAIISPAMLMLRRSNEVKYFLLGLLVAYLTYEILLLLFGSYFGTSLGQLLKNTLFYVVPYGVIFSLGLCMPGFSAREVRRLLIGALAIFIVFVAINWWQAGALVPTQEFKYPPTAYYLSYAMFASGVLWLLAPRLVATLRWCRLLESAMFLAQNTIWIYLWHIPLVVLLEMEWPFKYMAVATGACAIAAVQVTLVRRMILPRIDNVRLRRNLNILLTG